MRSNQLSYRARPKAFLPRGGKYRIAAQGAACIGKTHFYLSPHPPYRTHGQEENPTQRWREGSQAQSR